MNDPSTYWLNLTNILLGVVTVLCCAAVAFGFAQEWAARRRKRAAAAHLDGEIADLVSALDGHAFQTPSLGLTMADGGEPVNSKPPKSGREKR